MKGTLNSNGEFNYLTSIAKDEDGNVWLTFTGTGQVMLSKATIEEINAITKEKPVFTNTCEICHVPIYDINKRCVDCE